MRAATADIGVPAASYSDCSGCALCLLVCPIWRQTRDIELTPLGCCKALQNNAAHDDLAEAAQWCNLCGACAPVCPEHIDLVALMLSLGSEAASGTTATSTATDPAIKRPAVRSRLAPGDLLIIEPRRYHADYQHRVGLYDMLRRESGCMLNLDLQRIAIPARLPAPEAHVDGYDELAQARWIVQGLTITRIVVEDPADRQVFERLAICPVIPVDQLAKDAS